MQTLFLGGGAAAPTLCLLQGPVLMLGRCSLDPVNRHGLHFPPWNPTAHHMGGWYYHDSVAWVLWETRQKEFFDRWDSIAGNQFHSGLIKNWRFSLGWQ